MLEFFRVELLSLQRGPYNFYLHGQFLKHGNPRLHSTASHIHKLGIKSFQNSINGEILDDHRILAESGIPAIDIIDFDYPYWHTIEDTPDKCSPKSLKSVGDVIIDYIYN